MKNKINYKINIDKNKNRHYNKTEIEIFTYKEYIRYKKFIGEKINGVQEENIKYQIKDTKINNEHDKIFRKILDNKQEATYFINKTLHLEIKEEKLEKYNSSFITNNLKNQESDIIYKLKDKEIFFLIEHQSKIDYSMPYRILEYESEIMKSAIDYKKLNQKEYKLPLVITIVLYTGKKRWNAKRYIRDKQEKLKGYDEKIFAKFNVVDVNEFNNDVLLNDKSFLYKAMLIEKARDNEELVNYLENIVMNRDRYSDENKVILILIINLLLRKKIGEEKSNELVKILKGDDENMLAVLDMIEEDNKRIFRKGKREEKIEGKKEGKRENQIKIAKKLLQMKMPLKQIIEITELSDKDIENLK